MEVAHIAPEGWRATRAEMIKFLLTNANRSVLSHNLVGELVIRKGVDILVTTEPNRRAVASGNWCADSSGDVAFMSVNGRLGWQLHAREAGILAVELAKTIVIGVYISPNCDLLEYASFVDRIYGLVSRASKKVILMGDLNCKAVEADSSYTNRLGEMVTDMMHSTGLYCVNDNTPTFEARDNSSVLELKMHS